MIDLVAIATYNAGIRAAMNEYHLHPSAACTATTACYDLALDGSRYCRRHASNDPRRRKEKP